MTKIVALFAVALLGRCGITQEPDPQGSPCERACAKMSELGCEEAEPDEEGNTCVDVCEQVEKTGLISLHPECRAEQSSCEAMEENCSG